MAPLHNWPDYDIHTTYTYKIEQVRVINPFRKSSKTGARLFGKKCRKITKTTTNIIAPWDDDFHYYDPPEYLTEKEYMFAKLRGEYDEYSY
jgi:hypothetical protein